MFDFFATPLFGIIISIFAYRIGQIFQKKTGLAFFPPVLTAYIVIISFLLIFNIPVEKYELGGSMIDFFLAPVTIVLAVPLYKQLDLIKKNFIAVFLGILSGIVTCFISIFIFRYLFQLNDTLFISLLPKSITTPMALAVSEPNGGIKAITAISVVITGIGGAAIGPSLYRLLHFKNRVAKGIGLGSSAHALGTTRALEMGEVEGAFSGASICLTGVLTVLLLPLFLRIIGFGS